MEQTVEEKEYAAFQEKMKRTVYIDNLSPHVTEPVLRNALNQFGTVKRVRLNSNYLEPNNKTLSALVEMEKAKHARAVISEIVQFPFMVSGMPRPVRARPAEIEMFEDRPKKPGRKIQWRWLDSSDPDFQAAKKLKLLTWKHAAEASFLLKKQVEKEGKLHMQQSDTLRTNYKKYELIEGIFNDHAAQKLARRYGVRLGD